MRGSFVPPAVPCKDICNPKAVVDTVKAFVKWFLDTYEGMEGRRQGPDWAAMWGYVLSPVGKGAGYPVGREDWGEDAFPNPEETAALIMKSGIPRNAVKAERNHITISLGWAMIRIYRITSGYPAGSFRILRPGNSGIIRTGLSSRGLADLILAIDSATPDILKAMEVLDTGMKAADRILIARKKADEIERVTIQRLLDTVLPPLGITAEFEVRDGIVSVCLRKTLGTKMTVPVGRLQEILSDPDRIESSLKVESSAHHPKGLSSKNGIIR